MWQSFNGGFCTIYVKRLLNGVPGGISVKLVYGFHAGLKNLSDCRDLLLPQLYFDNLFIIVSYLRLRLVGLFVLFTT